MKIFSIIFILILIAFSFAQNQETTITVPKSIDFSPGSYEQYVITRNSGGSVVHLPGQGWNGADAVELFPPTHADDYTGLGWMSFEGERILSVRVLVKFSPECIRNVREDKFIIFNRSTDVAMDRTMAILDDFNNSSPTGYWLTFACAINAMSHWYPYEIGGPEVWYPNTQETFRIGNNANVNSTDGFEPNVPASEWICVEHHSNLDTKRSYTVLTTQDGRFGVGSLEDAHVARIIPNEGGSFTNINMIGGYFNDWTSVSQAGGSLYLSHLEIAPYFIGPPTGFVGGVVPPEPPNGYDPNVEFYKVRINKLTGSIIPNPDQVIEEGVEPIGFTFSHDTLSSPYDFPFEFQPYDSMTVTNNESIWNGMEANFNQSFTLDRGFSYEFTVVAGAGENEGPPVNAYYVEVLESQGPVDPPQINLPGIKIIKE